MVVDVTDESFAADVLESELPCVILFTGSWCTWCPEMHERMEEASKAFEGEAKVCSIDIDTQNKLRIAFAVGTLPFIVLVRGGMRSPLFDEIVTVERLEERVRYALDGGKLPIEVPVRWNPA